MAEEIDPKVEAELFKMVKDEPVKMMMWMLVQMGKEVVEINAGSMELKQESTIDNQRYEIKATIKVKKVK